MKTSLGNSVRRLLVAFTCALFVLGVSAYADGPVGKWDLTAEFGGQTNESVLMVAKEGDGLKGILTGDQGDVELDNVSFADGELKFDLTVSPQGQELTLGFSAKISGDSLDGNWSSDFGEFPVSGKRAVAKPSVVGTWNLSANMGGQTRESTLKIVDEGGELKATMAGPRGDRELEDLSFADGVLKFVMNIEAQGQSMSLDFSAKVAGDAIDGNWSSDFGEFPVTGKRAGAEPSIAGTWKLMVDSPLGQNERELIIKPDMTGTYGGGDFEAFAISNLKVDGDTATMDVTLAVQGQEMPVKITLKLDGSSVTGTLDYGEGEAAITGKKE